MTISKAEIARLQTQVRAANTLTSELLGMMRASAATKLSAKVNAALSRYNHAISRPAPAKNLAGEVMEAFDETYAAYESYLKNRKDGEPMYTYSGWLASPLGPLPGADIHQNWEAEDEAAANRHVS